ncbi:3-deoxy-D-manno-octulosonic acid transferase [Paraglaciecola aquimarina]|uniref:3-deoxy-D-manno-octulosonic acid transferase n=1 Tax=Paraglaciecola aquimarina TaxID=1235557 RepID=UPI00320497DA
MLVPRHQNRFDSVARLIEKQRFQFVRRSALSLSTQPEVNAQTQIVLGDTMGELILFWSIASVAFVGGSLVDNGGHNPLEPSLFNIPVISGQHVRNFKHIYQSLADRQGVVMVSDQDQLTATLLKLLSEQSFCQQLGNNAAQVLSENRGATSKLNLQINQLLAT